MADSGGNGHDFIGLLDLERRRIETLETHQMGQDTQLRNNTVAVEAVARALQGLGVTVAEMGTKMTTALQGVSKKLEDLSQSVMSMQKTLINRDVEEVLGVGVKRRSAR